VAQKLREHNPDLVYGALGWSQSRLLQHCSSQSGLLARRWPADGPFPGLPKQAVAAAAAAPSLPDNQVHFLCPLMIFMHTVCDPVMGDDGRLYVRPDIPAAFRDLIVPLVSSWLLWLAAS